MVPISNPLMPCEFSHLFLMKNHFEADLNKKGKKINAPNKCSIATIASDDILCRSCLNTPSTLHNNAAHITAADGKTLVNIARISFFEKQLQLEFQACPDVPKLEFISKPIDLAAYSHI